MANQNQSTQPLVQPQDTYQEFLTSGYRFVQRLYDFVTDPPQMPIDDSVPASTGECSPSTPIFPGSYPPERCSVIESTFDSTRVEQPNIPVQAKEELERSEAFHNRFSEAPAGPHKLSAGIHPSSSNPHVSEQRISSASRGSDGLGQHGAFCDRSDSDRPNSLAAFFNLSQNERSHPAIHSQSMMAAQFQGSHGFSISGNPNFTNIGSMTHFNNYGGPSGLEHAKGFVSFDALHNSAAQDPDRRCHPGTRVVVLKQMRDWIDNPNAQESVFWLHGPAGAGKSAIAQTIAHSYSRERVVATFFFYRSDPNRNDGNRLFITIAWQLAFSIPGIKEHIARSLDNQPDLPMKDVETQFAELIIRPLQELKQASDYLPRPVIIIDGVDECAGEKLQRRFLKVIGDAVKDNRIPLRFIISSRSEAHIQETVDRFPDPKLQIDLANLDDANRDIEKYLVDEFSRIASEQGLGSNAWPGNERIRMFVYKASGQFAYASTVIRCVDDHYSSAVTQLDIILGLKPQSSRAPFAELDALYMDILERQPDKDFIFSFLTLLVARSTLAPGDQMESGDFHLDDALIMNISEFQLRRTLRGMRSLLKFDPHIDLHHRSFLDFLQDPSRSCRFYISQQNAQKRYLELIAEAVVRFVSKIIDQPDFHEAGHFCPQFYLISRRYPRRIKLPVTDWQEALQPLLSLQDKMLILPNFTSAWNLLPCDTCTVFQIMRDLLLHLVIMQGAGSLITPSIHTEAQVIRSATISTQPKQNMQEDDMDGDIYSLLTQLRNPKLGQLVDPTTIQRMCSLLRFNYVEIAKRVRSVVDAQNLMNFIDRILNDNYLLDKCVQDTAHKAALVALEIYSRVPVLPSSLFSNSGVCPSHTWSCRLTVDDFGKICQGALLGRILDRNHIVPLLQIYEGDKKLLFVSDLPNKSKSLKEWRKTSNPSSGEIIQVILKVARTIRYFHSIGVVFTCDLEPLDIFLDSTPYPKFRYLYSTTRYITETPLRYFLNDEGEKKWSSCENNVLVFGGIFYEIYFDRAITDKCIIRVPKRPAEPTICEDAWQLIQRCCARDPKDRPTMDQVVQEMEFLNLG